MAKHPDRTVFSVDIDLRRHVEVCKKNPFIPGDDRTVRFTSWVATATAFEGSAMTGSPTTLTARGESAYRSKAVEFAVGGVLRKVDEHRAQKPR